VSVSIVGTPPRTFTIVGRAVLPTAGHTANLGEGSLVVEAGLEGFGLFGGPTGVPDKFVIRFRPGADVAAAMRRIEIRLRPIGWSVVPPTQPADLLNFGRNKNLPFVLSGMLGLLALATLGHALFTSINRRRRDLAILKTMGFTRGDTRRAVAWQSTTFIAVALAFGIAGGVIAGRSLWTAYAHGLGIIPEPRVPGIVLLALVPAGIAIANALALLPGRRAARTRPALVLRAE
jgi:ABC-type antimicrobial peptide transport system permease subunit